MANETINQLPGAATLTQTELVPMWQNGGTVQAPISSLIASQKIPSGTLLGNSSGVSAPPQALFSLPAVNASPLLVEVTGGTFRSLQSRAQDVANIADFGAPLDTVYSRATISVTAGSAVVSGLGGIPAALADGVARIVISGIGPSAALTASAANGGSGYVVGDTIILTGGVFTTPVTLVVLQVSAGAITNSAVIVPGSYTTAPTNPVAQGSTSGSGTGALFTVAFIGLPLQTTISSISGGLLTLAIPAVTGVTGADQWIAAGHDNAPAINAAIATGTRCIYFPSNSPIGIFSSITLPTGHQYMVQGNGTTLVALTAMTSMLNTVGASFWDTAGSLITSMTLDGMGLAQYNVNEARANHTWFNLQLLNATVTNLFVNGGTSINNYFSHLLIYNTLRPPGLWVSPPPASLISLSNTDTDNHFSQIIGAGAQSGFIDGSGGGTFIDGVHMYGITAGPSFSLGSAAFVSNIYADNPAPGQAGLFITGNYNMVSNYWSAGTNCYALQFAAGAVKNSVSGTAESIPQANIYPGIGALSPQNVVNILGAYWPWSTNFAGINFTGAGTGATITMTSPNGFSITCGTGASRTILMTMPIAFTGWSGTTHNITTPAITGVQQGFATNSITFFYSATAPNSGDIIVFQCQAF